MGFNPETPINVSSNTAMSLQVSAPQTLRVL